jgi:hypothetical protein
MYFNQVHVDNKKTFGESQIAINVKPLKQFKSEDIIGSELEVVLPSNKYAHELIKLKGVFIDEHPLLKELAESKEPFKIKLIEPKVTLWEMRKEGKAGVSLSAEGLELAE